MSAPATPNATGHVRSPRRSLTSGVVLFAACVLGLTLTACADAGDDTSSGASASANTSQGPLDQEASKIKDTVAQRLGDQDVTADAVRQALLTAGWSADDVEVSQNRTPTGLDVDKIEAGVRTQDGCVIAEVRPDNAVTVSTGVALSTGRCLAGHAYGQ